MKRSISLILAALLLASSMTACGDTSKEHETKAETNAPVAETADTAETEAPAPSYDTSLLTENGIAKAHIVLSADAGETLRYAAEELVYHIKKVTGADITVSETVQENALPVILATPDTLPELETLFEDDLAWLRRLSEEFPEGGGRRWGDDGFAIRTHEGKVYIFGANEKGALNGTYDFIEENMGVLWARSNEEIGLVYTETPTVTVTKTNYREKSPFQVRGWGFTGLSKQEDSATLLARNKMNSLSALSVPEKGIKTFSCGHNVKLMVINSPVYDPEIKEYWNTYPDGSFQSYETSKQINFWSDKAAEAVAESVIAYIRDGVTFWGLCAGDTHVFIGMEDEDNGLTAPFDSQPVEYAPGQFVEPTNSRYRSTVFFLFINKVTRLVNEVYPGTQIATFAYSFSTNPPLCEIDDNVTVMVAPLDEDLTASLFVESDSPNVDVFKRLETWKSITDNLVIYNYYGCFKPADRYTRPIWDMIQENLQYYAENGFLGVQPEGVGDDENGYWWVYDGFGQYASGGSSEVTNSNTWDFNGMTYWIYSKLSWNPYEDVDALIKEYCDKYYGGASEYMQEYYRLIKAGWHEGRQDLPYDYKWNVAFDVYMDCFVVNDNFVENAGLHEKIVEALNNAWNAANDIEKERIRYLKETMELAIEDWTYVP